MSSVTDEQNELLGLLRVVDASTQTPVSATVTVAAAFIVIQKVKFSLALSICIGSFDKRIIINLCLQHRKKRKCNQNITTEK